MSVADLVQRKNIVVTGGAGFIGSHLCDALIKEGNIICVDNLISGSIANINHLLQLPNFEFIKHDLSEPIDLDALPELKKFKVPFHGIQEVYHLACPTSHYEKHEHQMATVLSNGLGTKHALDIAVKYHAKFLFTSSSAVYGEPIDAKSQSYTEDYWGFLNQLGPRACYDEGKRYAETLVDIHREQHKLETRILRLFQTYGPRMSMNDNRMVPRLVTNAIKGEPMVIYGEAGDSTTLCYITDMIEAIRKMMKSTLSGPINVGSMTAVTLKEVAETIKSLAGASSEINFEPESPYTHHRGVPDITLAKNKLGWFPVIPLSEGLKFTIDDLRGSDVVGIDEVKI
ncbi:MAG: GDP-mannose 4,6-dehydratase [bacterium]|nr:GDP-mannose 4,6-dehydratase [bacterium]